MLVFNSRIYDNKPVFGRLTVLRCIGKDNRGKTLWLCGCRCGNYIELITTSLTRKERPATSCFSCADHTKYPKEYKAYAGMHERCYNSNHKDYKHYGERGIAVTQEWRIDFFNFFEYIGFAPTQEHSLDRIDVNKNYEPGNVRWATKQEQALNRRNPITKYHPSNF